MSDSNPEASLIVPRDQLPLPRPYLAPRSPTERRLAEIWRAVLSMDCVGIEDDYRDLGGDSLHALTIFEEINTVFRLDLPVATLLETPNVATLARLIDRRLAGK